jgi:large subunit ribosomal protein L28
MARICTVCGKGPIVANSVSNANNRVKHWVYPNVHSVRFTMTGCSNGKVMRGKVCTKCMKAGKIQKVV